MTLDLHGNNFYLFTIYFIDFRLHLNLIVCGDR